MSLISRSDSRRLLKGGDFEEYYKTVDDLIENGTSSLKKELSKLQKDIWKGVQDEAFWEDGIESVLQIGNNFELESDAVALKFLNAQIIGRAQIVDKVESLQSASFASQGKVLFDSFAEAREYMESRFNLPATVFHQTSQEMKKYAFTVASIVREDILLNVSDKLLESYDRGFSFNSFKKSLKDGKLQKELEELTDKQLELVYTQNMNSAYSYGRYQGLMEAVDIFPNWEYITIGDNRVRASHKALNGTIRRFDDPFWKSFYPPNGYRCRCVVEVSTEEPTGKGVPIWDKETVDKAFEDGIYPKNFQLGKTLKPDYGFDHNIGEMNGWVKDRIKKNNAITTGTRTSFFTNTNPLKNWDKNKNVLSAGTDYSKLDKGLEKAKDHLKGDIGVYEVVFDKKGNMVGSDFDYILEHISTSEKGKSKQRLFDEMKWKSRAPLVDVIKDIIETGDIVEDIERYGKSRQLVLSRKYVKNVKLNGESTPVMIIAEYPKFEKDSIPTLTTVYPFKKEDQSKKISGIFLK